MTIHANRAERRRLKRRKELRWARFVRDVRNGHSWQPFGNFTPAELRAFIGLLASRKISWKGSDKCWKAELRRVRRQREAVSLRVEWRANDAAG